MQNLSQGTITNDEQIILNDLINRNPEYGLWFSNLKEEASSGNLINKYEKIIIMVLI